MYIIVEANGSGKTTKDVQEKISKMVIIL